MLRTARGGASFLARFVDDSIVLLLFHDKGVGPDLVCDSMIVRLDVLKVPFRFPATFLLPAGGLGGLAALRQRRRI